VTTLDDIRRLATAFPEVEEFTHFRQPAFEELIERAWRNKAPKRVVAAYDAR
jgi:hypothetical protein